MSDWWIYPIFGAFLLSVILTDVFRQLAIRFDFLDRPTKKRKKHLFAVPTLGGVAIFFAFLIPTLIVLAHTDHFTSGEIEIRHFMGFFAGAAILIIGGLLDDKLDLSPKYSIIFPVAAALIAAIVGIGPSKITNPLGGAFEIVETAAFIFTFIWLLGMSYTTKLLDGMDGLATGVTAIGTFMIALLALSAAYFQPDVALLALIAFAALIGFLMWNFHPAQIFLGEGGSTFIGYLLGTIAIISGSKVATALLVVGIPAFDIVFVITQRILKGKPIFVGDRLHLHHKLFDIGFSQRQIVIFYYCIAIVFGLTTLIFASWQKLI
ncbi:MAG: MraY family glycosyltransferase, partial [Patescibacteria group bacterium]